jgi:hypothetical protein
MIVTRLAMDRASVRSTDQDGRLHVAVTNISKAAVNPYLGREIPRGEELGLKPDRVYHLLRHPDELAKAAATFNNLPLLSRHVPVTAAEPQPNLVVGSTGTDAEFAGGFLRNSLVVWDAGAIARIESDEQRELSSAYYYDADMTPGTFGGVQYDGIMRNLRGNHVALVEAGRAGPDVIVGDSLTKELVMKLNSRKALVASGALTAYLAPRLAMDASVDLAPVLKGVTAKNWTGAKARIASALAKATEGKLAQDADISDVVAMLDKLDDVTDEAEAALDEDEETPEEKEARMAKRAADKAAKDAENEAIPDKEKDKDMPNKAAMDAAIAAGVADTVARMNAIHEAERVVRPWIGELAMAQDSAEAVYRLALDSIGVKVDGVHPSALRAILEAQPRPDAAKPKRMAQDAKGAADFAERFPAHNRLKL